MGEFAIRDLEKVVVLARNLDGTYSEPTPGGGTGSDVNVTNAIVPVTLKDAGGDIASITAAGYLEVRIAETAAGGGGLTDAELRAAAVPVSLSGSVAVTGPLTDTQLRATAVPVSGPLTDAQLRAAAVPISDGGGSITVDGTVNVGNFPATQPVSGTFWQAVQPVNDNGGSLTVDGTFWQAIQPVTGPLTDAQLRAGAIETTTFGNFAPDLDTGAGSSPTLSSGIAVAASGGPAVVPGDTTNGLDVDVTRVQGSVAVTGTFWQTTQPVSGPLTDTQLRASAVPVSGPLTDAQLRATAVPVSGTFWQATQPVSIAATVATREATNATSAVTQVASSATNVTLKASNANRRGLSVHNDSTAILYLKLGATASTTSYTVKMAADSHYEVPFGYTGIVDGIWASANGNAYVTEIT